MRRNMRGLAAVMLVLVSAGMGVGVVAQEAAEVPSRSGEVRRSEDLAREVGELRELVVALQRSIQEIAEAIASRTADEYVVCASTVDLAYRRSLLDPPMVIAVTVPENVGGWTEPERIEAEWAQWASGTYGALGRLGSVCTIFATQSEAEEAYQVTASSASPRVRVDIIETWRAGNR